MIRIEEALAGVALTRPLIVKARETAAIEAFKACRGVEAAEQALV
jgi:hypothetical protein